MSLFLDQKYLMLVSNRLPLFKRKSETLFNCRCVICGDSTKKRNKARGYFFNYKNELRYKCHNCDASLSFGNFLKLLDQALFSQYSLEKYTEGKSINFSNTTSVPVFEEPKFKSSNEKLLDKLLDRLDTLPEDNEAVQFCLKRNIPRDKFSQLYYIKNIKDIVQLNDKYKASITGEEPRLILPFYNEHLELSGVTCRALRGEALRYITVKIKDDDTLIFNLENIQKNKIVYVVEGPIDSLFLDNCIAVSGTSFNKINTIGLTNPVVIFDNQPRNKEVCKLVEKSIDSGYNVVIWPQNIDEKDINEMVLAGRDINKLIKDNTFKGLTAKAKFIGWKRC